MVAGASTLYYLVTTRAVSNEITLQDETAIIRILQASHLNPLNLIAERKPDFAAQVAAIRQVQAAVLAASPVEAKIAVNQPREPADLLAAGHGQCNDRARTLDKTLRFLGYESRYASLYERGSVPFPWLALLRNGRQAGRSHAVVEVKTDRGWLVVDTVPAFVSVRAGDQPVSLKEIAENNEYGTKIQWKEGLEAPYWLLSARFVPIYGLYGRHGRFFAPYDAFPDINWQEFRLNWQESAEKS